MTQIPDYENKEAHKSHRTGWLRAAVLGVNDGIVSTSGLMLGVLGATSNPTAILTAGIAGLAAGAISMAAGEYVSVHSQRDSEKADIELERQELERYPEEERQELIELYEERGLTKKLATQVVDQLHAHDALEAHVRDELNIDQNELSRPFQAAFSSMAAFAIGAAVPIFASLMPNGDNGGIAIVICSLLGLAISGGIGASIGGGHRFLAALRVLIGGALAMAVTYGIGLLVGQAL